MFDIILVIFWQRKITFLQILFLALLIATKIKTKEIKVFSWFVTYRAENEHPIP